MLTIRRNISVGLTLALIFVVGVNAVGAVASLKDESSPVRLTRYEDIIMPNIVGMNVPLFSYYSEMLVAALGSNEDLYGQYILSLTLKGFNRDDLFAEFEKKMPSFSVLAATSRQYSKSFTRIGLPLTRGLAGTRVFVVLNNNSKLLSKIHKLDQLKTIRIGIVLNSNEDEFMVGTGLNLVRAESGAALETMFTEGKVDTILAGVLLSSDMTAKKDRLIDPHLVLTFPNEVYFYTTFRDPVLAKRLQDGTDRIVKNGMFQKIFDRACKAHLDSLNLKSREVISIKSTDPISDSPSPLNYLAI